MRHVHFYTVHGLIIGSELELPELTPLASDLRGPADVNVHVGELSPALKALEAEIPDFVTTENGQLLVVPGAARLVVAPDCTVTVELAENPDIVLLRLFLFGSVMGLICHQRGLLPLHASAVAVGNRAIAFCGPPGMGKSTLAAFCVDAGARLVADDILVVTTDRENGVIAKPGMPKVKLWRDALDVLGRATDGLVRDWARSEKFHVHAGQHIVTEPVRLEHILVLDANDDAGIGLTTPLAGASAVSELIQNTYRAEYLDIAHRRAAHFAECARLSRLTKVTRLTRRRDIAALRNTAAMLLDSYLSQP
jgi:hypothetical protein